VNEVMVFLQQYGTVLVLLSQGAVLLLASKFVPRTVHDHAIATLDAKFVSAIDKIDKVEDRLAKLENEFRHLPDRDSVHKIDVSLEQMKGELKALGEKLQPVAKISDRLQEFLLEQAKR
jgi:predicted  nucleic acid-binding Zn-ribbon protein